MLFDFSSLFKKSMGALLLFCAVFFSGLAIAGDSARTKYPIVLVHGLFGFDDILGVDYFYRVPYALKKEGATVYIAKVSAGNSSEVRGEQLLTQVKKIQALSGAKKVHLIGHSQGSQTARYVASVNPERVASVTSIGGVNWGSPVADIVRNKVTPGSVSESVAAAIGNSMAKLIDWTSGHGDMPKDVLASLESLTTEGSIKFNQKYPEGVPAEYCGQGKMLADNGVYYFSWSGASPFTNIFDPLDAPLKITSLAFSEPNDGLVSACSSHLGYVIKDNYRMNHVDEINHSFGIHHLFETDPVTLYRQHAKRLKELGL